MIKPSIVTLHFKGERGKRDKESKRVAIEFAWAKNLAFRPSHILQILYFSHDRVPNQSDLFIFSGDLRWRDAQMVFVPIEKDGFAFVDSGPARFDPLTPSGASPQASEKPNSTILDV